LIENGKISATGIGKIDVEKGNANAQQTGIRLSSSHHDYKRMTPHRAVEIHLFSGLADPEFQLAATIARATEAGSSMLMKQVSGNR